PRVVADPLPRGGCGPATPPANYWRAFASTDDATEATAQVFFGVRLLCAKCHDHPFEKWVQDDYYGLAAFFTQVGRKPGSRRDDVVVFRTEAPAQTRHPTSGATVVPHFLGGAAVPVAAGQDARALLADWMTRKDNPYL